MVNLKQNDVGIPIMDIKILGRRLRTNNITKTRLEPGSKHPLSFSLPIVILCLLIIIFNFLSSSLFV